MGKMTRQTLLSCGSVTNSLEKVFANEFREYVSGEPLVDNICNHKN